jgi:hypothetical protein
MTPFRRTLRANLSSMYTTNKKEEPYGPSKR